MIIPMSGSVNTPDWYQQMERSSQARSMSDRAVTVGGSTFLFHPDLGWLVLDQYGFWTKSPYSPSGYNADGTQSHSPPTSDLPELPLGPKSPLQWSGGLAGDSTIDSMNTDVFEGGSTPLVPTAGRGK